MLETLFPFAVASALAVFHSYYRTTLPEVGRKLGDRTPTVQREQLKADPDRELAADLVALMRDPQRNQPERSEQEIKFDALFGMRR